MGGCLSIHEVLYSCDGRTGSDEGQLSLVRGLCQGKELCRVDANRETFGHAQCPRTCDYDMRLRILYSCDEGFDQSNTCTPTCDLCLHCNICTTTPPITTHTPPTPTPPYTTPTPPYTTPTPPVTTHTPPTPTPPTTTTTTPSPPTTTTTTPPPPTTTTTTTPPP